MSEQHYANHAPAEQGKIVAITLDTTSRIYDLGAVNLGGLSWEKGGKMYVTLISTVAFYYKFNSANSGTADEAAADAAGAGPTFQANAVALAPANLPIRVFISRKEHRYLILKGSGAGVFRMWVSSHGTTR